MVVIMPISLMDECVWPIQWEASSDCIEFLGRGGVGGVEFRVRLAEFGFQELDEPRVSPTTLKIQKLRNQALTSS